MRNDYDNYDAAGRSSYDDDQWVRRPEVLVETRRDRQLAYPSYTDARFKKMQTLFGKEDKEFRYEYDDRLIMWDYDAHERGIEGGKSSNKIERSVDWIEAYLSAYYEKPVVVGFVEGMANLSSGFPVYVYGFKFKEEI